MKSSRRKLFVLGTIVCALFLAMRGTARSPQQQKSATEPVLQKDAPKTDEASEGAKRFAANCGRCHQPPEDISPKEAKAVIRHMRVRANLSAEDERLILKFIAP